MKLPSSKLVASGNGTPGNGGTLVRYTGESDGCCYSLRCITHRLMGNEYSEAEDVYELWEYKWRDPEKPIYYIIAAEGGK